MMNSVSIVKFILICLSFLFCAVSLSLLGPFYPEEAKRKSLSDVEAGLVIGSAFFVGIIATPLAASNIDRLGRNDSIIIGLLICALGNVLFGLTQWAEDHLTFLCLSILLRVVIASGSSIVYPASYSLAAKLVGEKNRGKGLAAVDSSFGLGEMLGPPVGAVIYKWGGFYLPSYVVGTVLFLIACLMIFLLQFPSNLTPNQKKEDEDSEIVPDVTWGLILKSPTIQRCFVNVSMISLCWYWYSATLEPFLSETFALSVSQTGMVFMAGAATYTITTPMFGVLVDNEVVTESSMIIIGNLVLTGALVFLGPLPVLSFLPRSYWFTIGSIFFQGVGASASYLGSFCALLKGLEDVGLPQNEKSQGMVSSLYLISDCLGGYLGAVFGSLAYQNMGFKSASIVPTILMALVNFAFVVHSYIIENKREDRSIAYTKLNTMEVL